jgi:hypothetical protein
VLREMTGRRSNKLVLYLRRISPSHLFFGIGLLPLALIAQRPVSTTRPSQLKAVEVNEKNGQILSYRYLGGTTEVAMRGTFRAPDARIKLKVGSRPGFVELDINRGQITSLKPANQFGRDFLTYVLWSVSVDGKAANLGEITFQGDKPISVNVTTPYQTFWLMLTAEPTYAVVDPSPVVVLYSFDENHGRAIPEKTAQGIPGELFYYTHYANYDQSPGTNTAHVPVDLLQARKAVELASKSSIFAKSTSNNARNTDESEEEERALDAFQQSKVFLERAEAAFAESPTGSDVAQFSRTAAQIAENARALAQGAVGGVLVSQLERELTKLHQDLAKEKEKAAVSVVAAPPESPVQLAANTIEVPSTQETSPPGETPQPATLPEAVVDLFKKPVTWFGVLGWGVALLLLFRKRSI